MRALIMVIVLGLTLPGCAPLKQYHPAPPYLKNYDLDTPLASCSADDARKADFQHGFVEFDEYGNLLNPAAFEAQMADIRAVQGPVLIVTYLHGWRHSAAPDDEDVREFKLAMRNIAAMDGCKRKVIGLYMGWRGQVFARNSPLDLITFWDRKQTAHSVGSGAVTEVLLRLDKERVRRNSNSQLQAKEDTQSRLVFIGHSFGAAVLYTALAPILVERFTQSTSFDPADELSTTGCQKNPKESLKTVGDLVVLINPAFEAMRLATLQKLSMGCHYTKDQQPVLAIVTGTTDLATKRAFHIARAPRARFQKYTADVPEGYQANSTAVGHYGPYQTHFLSSPQYSTDSAERQTFEGCEQYVNPLKRAELRMSLTKLSTTAHASIATFTSQQKQKDGTPKYFVLMFEKNPQLKNPPDHNPVLNVKVSAPIIDGHGGIYSCQLMTFIGGLITQTISN
ncbi:hypothetical protein JFT91_18030 [Pseudomonas sp. TH08]|uniref:hypothetical protein n=1 Tax=unclassified Pseudomonas TaxID=196821 RepID=UPI001913C04B|nr:MULTISPECIES: hypothetical protein [unclassified Pseudomonas]MBK5529360.1 hypothetical protein [Pseudomonas sp. TH06]MBK5534469.1 hypothetical protein [Pseudomonas sp. TH08]